MNFLANPTLNWSNPDSVALGQNGKSEKLSSHPTANCFLTKAIFNGGGEKFSEIMLEQLFFYIQNNIK